MSKLKALKLFAGALTMTYGAIAYGYELHNLFADKNPDKSGWHKVILVSGTVAIMSGAAIIGDFISDITMEAYNAAGAEIAKGVCDGTLAFEKADDVVKVISTLKVPE